MRVITYGLSECGSLLPHSKAPFGRIKHALLAVTAAFQDCVYFMWEAAGSGVLRTNHQKLRNQYNVGYTPSENTGTGFRHIKLRIKDGKYEVVARSGYYPRS